MSLIKTITKDILMSLKYLKNKGIVHCDLKPENILFKDFEYKQVKIIDFGSSTFVNDVDYTYLQTRPYRAPEMVFGCSYDFSIDIWSLGCILYEIITKKVLFNFKRVEDNIAKAFAICNLSSFEIFQKGKNYKKIIERGQICQKIKDQTGESFFDVIRPNYNFDIETELNNFGCDMEVISFIKRCIEIDPVKRITVEECLKHDFVRK